MLMRNDQWSLKNEWLNEFAEAFVRDKHRLVRDVVIESEEDCVVVCGRARPYYAVQLAIHSVQNFNRERTLFPMTRLTLNVHDGPLELRLKHRVHQVQGADASTQMNIRRRELTVAG